MRLLRGKKIAISVTLNKLSANELQRLGEMAREVGASVEVNILSKNLFFFKDANIDPMWPGANEVGKIAGFLQDTLKRPDYEVDYVKQYYKHELAEEPPCVLGYLQMFVLSNGDVLTGCYPLPPVGNILRESLESILSSKAYADQCEAMVRRECPGCTCGVESSLAMKHAVSSGLMQIGGMFGRGKKPGASVAETQAEVSS
jgi:MoaA/NifB/PqqE/SkfB family radical SAM enzyme